MRPYITRNANNIPQFKVKHDFFRNSSFHSVVIEWKKLDQNICNSENLNIFKEKLSKFICPLEDVFSDVMIPKELNY